MDIMNENVKFTCCFCGKAIEIDNINPCDLSVMTRITRPKEERFDQNFYCHIDCLKTRLHDSIQDYLVVDILE